jgi:transcriptional regulator with XRE-family HTH domain
MEKSVNARIKEIRKALNLSQRDFAKSIFVSQSLYGAIELEGRKVNNRHIALIVYKYKANKDWILTGKGPMFLENLPDVKFALLAEIFIELNQQYQDFLLLQSKELLRIQNTPL